MPKIWKNLLIKATKKNKEDESMTWKNILKSDIEGLRQSYSALKRLPDEAVREFDRRRKDPLINANRLIRELEEKYGVVRKPAVGRMVKQDTIHKGKGERHFYIENGKPVQWTGETHKHPDGTLMSGKEHKEGVSKKLFHFYELDKKHLKHLSKETTTIR